MSKAWQARMAARHNDQQHGDAIERLRQRADVMSERATQLKTLADAAQPLYASLTDDQKHRLHMLMRVLRPHHAYFAEWREHHHDGDR